MQNPIYMVVFVYTPSAVVNSYILQIKKGSLFQESFYNFLSKIKHSWIDVRDP